ncbi:MAG: T9SS type A sorting domain-containing protein [Saprospiraceae bacterium]|nr:T9SS type A sorting domain-containing protein [Saprospiraceae bacterium]
MKTFLVFLLFPTLSFAQTWAPIGAKWTYTQGTINPNYTTFKTFESIGDTVINGQSCKILTIIEHYGPGWSDTTQQYTYSDSNRVYFLNGTERCLIYDFNAQQGDTFVLNCNHGSIRQPFIVKVLSVDTITINGHPRKRFDYLADDIVVGFSGTVIEGIGNINGMFPIDHHTYNGPLRCYEDSILGLYKNQYYNWNSAWQLDCDLIITGVDDQTVSENLKVFPNPFNNHLTLQFANNEQTTVTFYDLMGKHVLHHIFTNYSTINTEPLLAGIYFYEVRNNNGIRKTGKIVKQ